MSAASVRGRIGEDLVSTLEAISVAHGYQNDVEAVFRGLIAPEGQPGKYIELVAGKQTYGVRTTSLTERLAPFDVLGHIETHGDASAELDEFLADVEKAILADRTRGGVAVDTELVDVDLYDAEAGSPWALFVLRIRVLYRTKTLDPTVAG